MDRVNTEQFWDKMATGFDQNSKYFQLPPIERAKAYLNEEDHVLDVGCATGVQAIAIAKCVAKVKGIDLSSKMIEIAKAKVDQLDLENVSFEQASILDDTNGSSVYDVVIAFNVLHFFEDMDQVLNVIRKSLRPQGRIIIVTACMGEKGMMNMLQRIAFTPLMRIGKIPFMQYFRSSKIRTLLISNGFRVDAFEKLSSSNYFIVASRENDPVSF